MRERRLTQSARVEDTPKYRVGFPIQNMTAQNHSAPRLEELTPEARGSSVRCILIHGTWVPEAPWTDSSSEISQSLRRLAGGSVHLSRFIWSGANNQLDRERAADQLAQECRELAAQNPWALILLVGHSHGGNIAMQAVHGIPCGQRAGIICMATPFIHVRARDTFPTRWLNAAAAQVLTAGYFAVMGGLAYVLTWLFPWLYLVRDWIITLIWNPAHAVVWHSLAALVGVLFYSFMYVALGFKEPTFVTRQQAERIARWQRIRPEATPVLCIFYRPDEAFWGLRAARFTGELGHAVTTIVATWALPVLAIAAIVVSFWFGWISSDSTSPTRAIHDRVTNTALALMLSASLIAIVPVVLWVLVGVLGSFARCATGKISLFDHLFLDIHASRVPPIPTHHLVEAPLHVTGATGWLRVVWASLPFSAGLIHSRVYSDERTFDAIHNWFNTRVGIQTAFPSIGTGSLSTT